MRRMRGMNQKLMEMAKNAHASDEQLQQLSHLANQYGNKSQNEIEQEMNKLIEGFSNKEKKDLINKLQMLKGMTDLLNSDQRRKVDMFIQMLSR
ncbi:hypothetical protein [Inediibacterium massiliense]|uniref:hypothetical protein n=1 Tax=Inediibacterium massiliense TaxID=1658111 RepID=UPI0006B4D818|nr:hypothetical protein [Inediibacterium massiliense]